jgi:signal peptide peptidase SppA
MIHSRECFANHMGLWLCKPEWLAQAVAHVRAGTWRPVARARGDSDELFEMAPNGVAVIPIAGPMMKGESKYGGANTLGIRAALRQAVATDEVKGVLLHIDSPGGHVAGTQALAADVARLGTKKPIHAHIDDMGASAAYWVASRAGRITASPTSEVGSIGVVGVLEDSSKEAEIAGIKVHVITTGKYKAMGAPGTEVTDEHLDEAQRLVDGLFSHFQGDVQQGRGLSDQQVRAVSDGRTWLAADAKRLGLIDRVGTLDEAVGGFPKAPRRARAAEWLQEYRSKLSPRRVGS